MLDPKSHAVLDHLFGARRTGPLVVAHRGDSLHHPENTLAAFRAAAALAVPMQEFDVRQLRDGTLVCVHDATFDRTTDAARRLGPGLQAAAAALPIVRTLDAGSWFDAAHTGERVPTLREALEVIAPAAVPMIEHKAGDPAAFVAEVRAAGVAARCIVQSFDWHWVAAFAAAAPDIAVALLGPTPECPRPDAAALAAARRIGAVLLHWCATGWATEHVARAHAAGLATCSYTTDDELGWRGGEALGLDAMCTNDPAGMSACFA